MLMASRAPPRFTVYRVAFATPSIPRLAMRPTIKTIAIGTMGIGTAPGRVVAWASATVVVLLVP